MYEALKLIEMISFFQMDEFFLNQWMFVFDYFGLQIEMINSSSNSIANLNIENKLNSSMIGEKGGVIVPF